MQQKLLMKLRNGRREMSEKEIKIGYLGPVGSYSHQLVKTIFGNNLELAFDTITDVIEAYDQAEVDFAVLPIENSIEGTVNLSIDHLFHKSKAKVVAEIILPIHHQLLALSRLEKVDTVYSHPQALAQTRQFLKTHYPKARLVAMDSTAQAASYVKEHPRENVAAVANQASADFYGLTALSVNIQDVQENFTRFWVLGKEKLNLELEKIEQKVSLALTLPKNLPGALHKAISVFAWREIDMTKIESRPLKTQLGQYFFIVDLVACERLSYALEELESLGISVRLLGHYNVYGI